MLAADALYAAEAKSVPEFPLEISAQKSTDWIKKQMAWNPAHACTC